MYIKRVRIENVRSIERLDWSVPEASAAAGWHVLIGDNGSGKTSVLRAIALALVGPEDAPWLRLSWSDWLRNGQPSGYVHLSLDWDKEYDKFSGTGRLPKNFYLPCGIRFVRDSDRRSVKLVRRRTSKLSADRHVWGGKAGWFSASYGPFRRFSGGDLKSEKLYYEKPRLSRHLTVFGEAVALSECIDWLKRLHHSKLEAEQEGRGADAPEVRLLSHVTDFLNGASLLPHSVRLEEISPDAARWLDVWQGEINSTSTRYAKRVERAKLLWDRKRRTKTFETVADCLTSMCSGARRCCYCEDSFADEIEHIKPKDLFPRDVFRWPNYLYACGPCNGPKNNQFAVFSQHTGEYTDITRRRGDPVEPPVRGTPVLINPRNEDPATFLQLDLRDTFYVLPLGRPGTKAYQRAEYTILVLRLNTRDYLPLARREAFGSYRARLVEYIKLRDDGARRSVLNRRFNAFRRMAHPYVWAEMKRQQVVVKELGRLFEQVPEALEW